LRNVLYENFPVDKKEMNAYRESKVGG